MSGIYLSIDIDYWSVPGCNRDQMISYLQRAIDCTDNLKVFLMHDEMLNHVNCSGASTLYNVDYHSDLADMIRGTQKDEDLNEGTWVNYVKFSPDGFFRWYYPEKECFEGEMMGRCESEDNPFVKNSYDICGWNRVSRRLRKIPDPHSLDIVGVGICISPDWVQRSLGAKALDFLFEEGIISKYFYDKAWNHVVARGKYEGEEDYVSFFDDMYEDEREIFIESLYA